MKKHKKLKNLLTFFMDKNNLKLSNRYLKGKDEQIIKDFEFEDGEALKREIQLIFSNLQPFFLTQTCILDKKQGFEKKDEDENYLSKKINDKEIFIDKRAIFRLEDDYEVKFDIYTSIFEVLLYLTKKQDFESGFYCIEINELFVYLILDNGEIKDYGIGEMGELFIEAKENPNLELIDYKNENDIYYVILYDRINKFYSSYQDCNFIENIFIFDDLFISPEIGYLIFTKLLIKTDIIKIDFVQILSDIAIEELKKKDKKLLEKFKNFLSLK